MEVQREFKKLPPRREGLGAIFNVNEPAPKVKNIRNDGSLGIAFNNNMRLPDDFMDRVTASKLRSLQSDEPAVIDIQSVAGSDSNDSELKLDWEITDFSESGLDFKLIYANPLEVS